MHRPPISLIRLTRVHYADKLSNRSVLRAFYDDVNPRLLSAISFSSIRISD